MNFFDISSLSDRLTGYNACYFCLGVTSLGKDEVEYTRLSYTLTLNFATTLASLNPDMTFCYISGAGTDSTEKGRTMWARVKGKTENDLLKLPFSKVYNFRPGGIEPFFTLETKPNILQNLQISEVAIFNHESTCSGNGDHIERFGCSHDKRLVDRVFEKCSGNERHESSGQSKRK